MKPKRIQLRRTKGWRLPPNAVNVARPTKWGNPFHAGYLPDSDLYCDDSAEAVRRFREWMDGTEAVANDTPSLVERRRWILDHMDELRGKDIACWCVLDAPCHGDWYLEAANR